MSSIATSADNHVDEPPHVCERVPSAMRDRTSKLSKGLSTEGKHAVLCGNAARIYGLES
jgi:hypothetical protein